MPTSSLDAIREHIDEIWVVDTHEHTTSEKDWIAAEEGLVDFSRFFAHYASVDLVSAGMPEADLEKVRSANTPSDEKWRIFEPFWQKARNTAYGKAVEEAIRGLFDLPGLNSETYAPLAARMREMRKPGYYRWVLKDRARIAVSILNIGDDSPDRELFAPVACLDHYVMARTREELRNLERESGRSIYSLDDLTQALGQTLSRNIELGIVAVKSPIAYVRTLNFEYPSKPDAERAFARMFAVPDVEHNDCVPMLGSGEAKTLQDYMFHRLVQMCLEHDLPMQIHTGIHEGNGNYLRQSNPALLNEVFMKYPRMRFDIFHAGYPYWDELGVMAKMFPGVHADLCWMNTISPAASRRALDEWLEVIPASKIFAFGGDYVYVEGAYAHAKIARENVARVLADKIDEGYFTLQEARHVADLILRENANEFFRLGL